jgi:20S proteasome alpha/beta subunit
MTCIVGIVDKGVIYIGADRGASDEESIISLSRPKIHVRDGWIFGYSGSLGTGQLLEIIDLPIPDKDVYRLIRKDIVSAMKSAIEDYGNGDSDHASDFLIGADGMLFEFNTSDWSVAEVKETAVGSGGPFALGSLYTSKHLSVEDRIKTAVESAIQYSPTCQSPIDILKLPI